jgi:hypothetical protein
MRLAAGPFVPKRAISRIRRPLTRKIELFIVYYWHVGVLIFAFMAGTTEAASTACPLHNMMLGLVFLP